MGDFALFVTYLDSVTYFPMEIARWLTGYRQAGVSASRLAPSSPAPVRQLAQPTPLPFSGPAPAPPAKRVRVSLPSGDRLETLGVKGLTFRYPGTAQGRPRRPDLAPGNADRAHRAGGSGQDDAPAGPPGAAAPPGRVRAVERPAGGGRRACSAPRGVHPAGAPPGQRVAAGQHPGRAGGGRGRPRRGAAPGGAGAGRGLPGAGAGDGGRPAGVRLSGGQVLRTGAARMLVREPELLVVDDLSSALDVETEATLWPACWATRLGHRAPAGMGYREPARRARRAGCLPPARRPGAGRPGDRAQGGAHRGPGNSRRCWKAAQRCATCGRAPLAQRRSPAAGVQVGDTLRIDLGPPVVGEQAVHLVLHVVELGVAEAGQEAQIGQAGQEVSVARE